VKFPDDGFTDLSLVEQDNVTLPDDMTAKQALELEMRGRIAVSGSKRVVALREPKAKCSRHSQHGSELRCCS
jgi:hypothetical protein